jgi:RNA polymerase sigma factor
MLSLLFVAKKRKKSIEEQVVLIQQGDVNLQNELIESYKPFIAKTVSSVCKRYIYESDDEFSIGLIAFNEAIKKYSPEKGTSLISFSEVVIKRRVIDYIRSQSKYQNLSLDTNQLNEIDSEGISIDEEISLTNYRKKTDEELRRDEILQFTEILHQFDLTFTDLIEQSPKHADARINAMNVAKVLVDHDELKNGFLEKKRLPVKQLESYVDVSRKTIERNRKYIIAISLILISDFHYLKDYIKGVFET